MRNKSFVSWQMILRFNVDPTLQSNVKFMIYARKMLKNIHHPRKKIIKPPQMYTKRKKHPDSVELYLPLESWGSDLTIAGLKRVFGENAVKLPHNEIITVR